MKTLRIFVWFFLLIGGSIGGIFLDLALFPKVINSLLFHIISFVIGIVLFYIVITISKNTGRTLAKYGREGDLPRLETNKLVKNGVYAYMRHPMHLGLILFPFAVAFLVGSLSFILIISPLEAVLILLLIKLVEEPEARQKFGKEYELYEKNTPAFCFKARCIRMLFKKVEKS